MEAFRANARRTRATPSAVASCSWTRKDWPASSVTPSPEAAARSVPDLAGIGVRYNREDIMTSILEPSKIIAQGYETIVVETKKGRMLTGVFKGESGDAVGLADSEGKAIVFSKRTSRTAYFLRCR